MVKEIESAERIGNQNIKHLIGVVHGVEAVDFFGEIHPIFIEPSADLQNVIKSFPKGSRVGIEYHSDISQKYEYGTFSKRTVEFSPSTVNYWQQIDSLCKDSDLEVVYLEDVKSVLESANHRLEVNFCYETKYMLEELLYLHEDEDEDFWQEELGSSPEELKLRMNELIREAYGHTVIADYILKVKREENIFDKIMKVPLDLLILGKAHADLLATNPIIEKYQSEVMQNGRYPVLSPVVNINNEEMLIRKLLTRNYYAVTVGRIDPLSTPGFIGYWLTDSEIPEEGLFEVYLDSNLPKTGKIRGIILDTLGDAIIEGNIDENTINFDKTYIKEKSSIRTPDESLNYSALKTGNKYMGKYSLQSGFLENTFILQQFDIGEELLEKLYLRKIFHLKKPIDTR